MEKIALNVLGQARSESAPDHFALILEEQKGGRRLPIIIGPFEAQAIAIALEKVDTGRAMTHDLLKHTIEALNATLIEVLIDSIRSGVFHAKLVCKKDIGEVVEIDARSSDAIALAVRFGCPISTFPEVMAEASIEAESTTPPEIPSTKGALQDYSAPQLEELLQKALEREDYESAAKIRDVIKSKEG